ncbi:hemerythrin domain-containing protein [Saccharopolyspora cebuensis]|uniref:Hemerythrin domain-containing protein n=1 Tax=Saccharopolyspora cebuensis TaxID=418759 RepID=A0ABV4CDG4_9PSEU
MSDITQLILDDHERFRRQFAAMDDLTDPRQLQEVWRALADLLEVHAKAEEEIFYPELISRGSGAEDETLDAVGDHNDIRDGLHEAALHPVGSEPWHAAVRKARVANSNHMAEEEDDALPDFRRHADPGLREELGRRFQAFKDEHPGAAGLDVGDIDPQHYVEVVKQQLPGQRPAEPDGSLGIGGLRERGSA